IRQRCSCRFRRGGVNVESGKHRNDAVRTDRNVPALPIPVLGSNAEGLVEFGAVEFWHGANLGSSWQLLDLVGGELPACPVDLATTCVTHGDWHTPGF